VRGERVGGLDARRQLRVRGERERDEADVCRDAAARESEVARCGEHRDAEATVGLVARGERRGEVEERERVALGHEREHHDVVAAGTGRGGRTCGFVRWPWRSRLRVTGLFFMRLVSYSCVRVCGMTISAVDDVDVTVDDGHVEFAI
jgi:hypothetical protein